VERAVRSFFRRKVLRDRDASVAVIQNMWREEGQLGLVLGGKSIGKSFLLRTLAIQQNEACEEQREFRRRQCAVASCWIVLPRYTFHRRRVQSRAECRR